MQRACAHCFGRSSAHSGLLPSTRRLLRFSLKPAGLLACGSTSGFPPSRAPAKLASAQWPLKNRTHRSQLRGQLRICRRDRPDCAPHSRFIPCDRPFIGSIVRDTGFRQTSQGTAFDAISHSSKCGLRQAVPEATKSNTNFCMPGCISPLQANPAFVIATPR